MLQILSELRSEFLQGGGFASLQLKDGEMLISYCDSETGEFAGVSADDPRRFNLFIGVMQEGQTQATPELLNRISFDQDGNVIEISCIHSDEIRRVSGAENIRFCVAANDTDSIGVGDLGVLADEFRRVGKRGPYPFEVNGVVFSDALELKHSLAIGTFRYNAPTNTLEAVEVSEWFKGAWIDETPRLGFFCPFTGIPMTGRFVRQRNWDSNGPVRFISVAPASFPAASLASLPAKTWMTMPLRPPDNMRFRLFDLPTIDTPANAGVAFDFEDIPGDTGGPRQVFKDLPIAIPGLNDQSLAENEALIFTNSVTSSADTSTPQSIGLLPVGETFSTFECWIGFINPSDREWVHARVISAAVNFGSKGMKITLDRPIRRKHLIWTFSNVFLCTKSGSSRNGQPFFRTSISADSIRPQSPDAPMSRGSLEVGGSFFPSEFKTVLSIELGEDGEFSNSVMLTPSSKISEIKIGNLRTKMASFKETFAGISLYEVLPSFQGEAVDDQRSALGFGGIVPGKHYVGFFPPGADGGSMREAPIARILGYRVSGGELFLKVEPSLELSDVESWMTMVSGPQMVDSRKSISILEPAAVIATRGIAGSESFANRTDLVRVSAVRVSSSDVKMDASTEPLKPHPVRINRVSTNAYGHEGTISSKPNPSSVPTDTKRFAVPILGESVGDPYQDANVQDQGDQSYRAYEAWEDPARENKMVEFNGMVPAQPGILNGASKPVVYVDRNHMLQTNGGAVASTTEIVRISLPDSPPGSIYYITFNEPHDGLVGRKYYITLPYGDGSHSRHRNWWCTILVGPTDRSIVGRLTGGNARNASFKNFVNFVVCSGDDPVFGQIPGIGVLTEVSGANRDIVTQSGGFSMTIHESANPSSLQGGPRFCRPRYTTEYGAEPGPGDFDKVSNATVNFGGNTMTFQKNWTANNSDLGNSTSATMDSSVLNFWNYPAPPFQIPAGTYPRTRFFGSSWMDIPYRRTSWIKIARIVDHGDTLVPSYCPRLAVISHSFNRREWGSQLS